MGAQHLIGITGGYLADVSAYGKLIGRPRAMESLGTIRPGGSEAIVSNSLASPTVVTMLNTHGLVTGDQIYWTASAVSVPLLTATPLTTVTVLTPTTFSLDGINCSTGGTSGGYAYAVLSIPTTPGAAPLVTCGRAHGLRVGDTVTLAGGNATPDLDGAQVVTAVPSATSFNVLTSAAPTTAAATVMGYFTKTTFYSAVLDRGAACSGGALVIASTIGTATCTVTCNIEGSVDGSAWFNIPYALVATPRTFVVTALGAITTAVTNTYLLQELVFWRYLRLKQASSTNVTLALTASYIE